MADEKRLIDANALMDAIEVTDWYHISPKGYLQKGANSQIHTPLFKTDDIFQALKDAPTVDAVEVVHSAWILNDDGSGTCKHCHRTTKSAWDFDNWLNYCPNCGAKMDGGKDK